MLRLLICGLSLFVANTSHVFAVDPVMLQYQPDGNVSFTQMIVRTIKQTQSVDSKTVNTESSHEEKLAFDEFVKTGSGDLLLTMRRSKLRVRWVIAGAGKYTFDSESPMPDQTSLLGRAYTPMYNALMRVQSQITVAPNGELKDVSNTVNSLAGTPVDREFMDRLVGSDADSLVRESYGEAWPRLPSEPVAPGAEWSAPVEVKLTGSGEVTGKRIYKLEKIGEVDGNQAARISYRSEIRLKTDVTENGIQRTGDLKATESTGDIVFDLKKGRAVSVKSSVRLQGTIIVLVQATQKSFEIVQDQTSTYEMTENPR